MVRDHEALRGRTPAEAARVERPFDSWEAVVERAASRRTRVAMQESEKPSGKPKVRNTVKPVVGPRKVDVKPEKIVASATASGVRQRKPNGHAKPVSRTVAYHPYLRKQQCRRKRR